MSELETKRVQRCSECLAPAMGNRPGRGHDLRCKFWRPHSSTDAAAAASYEFAHKTWCAYFVMIARLDKIPREPKFVRGHGLVLAAVYRFTRKDRDERLAEVVREHLVEKRGVTPYLVREAQIEAAKLAYDEQVRISGATET